MRARALPLSRLACTATLLMALAGCGSDGEAGAQSDAHADGAAADGAAADGGVNLTPPTLPDWGKLSWCEGATQHRYRTPEDSAKAETPELELWPDPLLTRMDPSSPTGLRIDASEARAPWVSGTAAMLKDNFADMKVLSGYGTNGGVLLRFTAPLGKLPDDGAHGTNNDAILLLDLSQDPPARVPYKLRTLDEGRDLILEPLRPMRTGALHAAVVTTELKAADGDCVAPAPLTRALMTGVDPSSGEALAAGPTPDDPATTLLRAHIDTATLLLKTGLRPDAISALSVFRTHDDLGVFDQILTDIRGHTWAWKDKASCKEVSGKPFVRCEASFVARDYRDGRAILSAASSGSWTLPVTLFLPKAGPNGAKAPWPTIVFGHGLSSARGEAAGLAQRVAPEGFAVVAVDALIHGDHPTGEGITGAATALEFLGLDLAALSLDALKMRGHFNQTVVDRMQLVELLRQAPDIDGDGAPDLDAKRLAYHGISLGGLLGVGLLAMRDELEAGVLAVAGGSLLTFATDNAQVDPFKGILYDLAGGQLAFDRLLVVAQALIDAADPATFAPFVLQRRRQPGSHPPDLLMPLSVYDETVPPSAGRALARALGAPMVAPVHTPVATLPTAATGVVDGNWSADTGGDKATAGTFQFDRVSKGGKDKYAVQVATHGSTPHGVEAALQYLHFWTTWRDKGRAQIIDPYAALNTPPLPAAQVPKP